MTWFEAEMFALGGVICGLTSYLVVSYKAIHTSWKRKTEYAAISALGSVAICYIAYRYFPDKFVVQDIPAASILIGLFGIGRVLDHIAHKFGLQDEGDKND